LDNAFSFNYEAHQTQNNPYDHAGNSYYPKIHDNHLYNGRNPHDNLHVLQQVLSTNADHYNENYNAKDNHDDCDFGHAITSKDDAILNS
jgi:hypothetical protein